MRKVRIFQYLFTVSLMICLCSSTISAEPVKSAFVQVELITDVKSIQPGEPFWVGLHMDMEGEWLVYWRNPGDSGLPTVIEWDLPKGFEVGEIQWPFPIRKDYPELTTYNYEDEVILLSKVTPPDHLEAGSVQEIKAHVGWLSCLKMCVQGEADLSLVLNIKDEQASIDNRVYGMFEDAKKRWPVQEDDLQMRVDQSGEYFNLYVIAPDSDDLKSAKAEFFPESNDLIDHMAKQEFSQIENGYRLSLKRSVIAKEEIKQFTGVLVLEGKVNFPEGEWFDFKQAYEVDLFDNDKPGNQ